ncbi:hypothetical protein [Neorhizobium huautlense]|uniref:hypothetical protein n=1 Tax=Neorhizobium huautlense TaxID=67774 RepID=UPI0027D7A733|nr:hypothetical protein [Neorhizobium huautlense]
MRSLHADICLIGASTVTGTMITERSLEVVSLKRAMIASAHRSILLADSSKFTVSAFCTLCDVSEMHEIINDVGVMLTLIPRSKRRRSSSRWFPLWVGCGIYGKLKDIFILGMIFAPEGLVLSMPSVA